MTIDSDSKRVVVSRDIPAPPEDIFAFLASPNRHCELDGSNTVQRSSASNPEHLTLGDRFSMDMKMGPIPYKMTSEVVEYEENRLLAWRHFGHHVWRFELEPSENGTLVTETFDWSVARFPPILEWVGYPKRHDEGIAQTLENLEKAVVVQ